MRFEIFDKEILVREFSDRESYTAEYVKHIGNGASGTYDPNTKIGKISSFLNHINGLKKQGYKSLNLCNGGDDDHLIADHKLKEFGLFEYFLTSQLDKCNNLIEFHCHCH